MMVNPLFIAGTKAGLVYGQEGHINGLPIDGDLVTTGRHIEDDGLYIQVAYKLQGQADPSHVYRAYFPLEEVVAL